MKQWESRRKYIVLSSAAFISGFLCFGSIGAITYEKTQILKISNLYMYTFATGLLGGYIIFSIISGILVTAKWISNRTLKQKIILAIFWIVPMYLVVLGMIYSIPYFIYNSIKYKCPCRFGMGEN